MVSAGLTMRASCWLSKPMIDSSSGTRIGDLVQRHDRAERHFVIGDKYRRRGDRALEQLPHQPIAAFQAVVALENQVVGDRQQIKVP